MKRSWKWQRVAPEAQRLAERGAAPQAIADQLGLNRSTVTRWFADGRLTRTPGPGPGRPPAPAFPEWLTRGDPPPPPPTPAPVPPAPTSWAAAVRARATLDDTDAQLVTLADAALTLAHDPTAAPSVRLQAMARFQALVKDLGIAIRPAEDTTPAPAAAPAPPTPRRDPRAAWLVQ